MLPLGVIQIAYSFSGFTHPLTCPVAFGDDFLFFLHSGDHVAPILTWAGSSPPNLSKGEFQIL